MRRLYERIEAAGATRGTILIVGESGTGKELVARAIHECGAALAAPFVALNCAAIPKDLIESELFGYKRGAFSGANADYLGLFRAAEGGTLFLDEVTEMVPRRRASFCARSRSGALDRWARRRSAGQCTPDSVDEPRSRGSRARRQPAPGSLLPLQAGVLNVPPLRERSEDIALLVEHLLSSSTRNCSPNSGTGVERRRDRSDAEYPWPGNVRELSNAIESAFTFSHSPVIGLEELPAAVVASRLGRLRGDRTAALPGSCARAAFRFFRRGRARNYHPSPQKHRGQ